MDPVRLRFGDRIKESRNTLGEVEERVVVYRRGLSAALAGLQLEETDDPWYDAGWRHGARVRALRTRKVSA